MSVPSRQLAEKALKINSLGDFGKLGTGIALSTLLRRRFRASRSGRLAIARTPYSCKYHATLGIAAYAHTEGSAIIKLCAVNGDSGH